MRVSVRDVMTPEVVSVSAGTRTIGPPGGDLRLCPPALARDRMEPNTAHQEVER